MRYMKNKAGKVYEVSDLEHFYVCHPDEYLRPATYREWESSRETRLKRKAREG